MKQRTYICICCIALLCIFLTASWLRSKEGFDDVPLLEGENKMQYVLHQAELVPREDIRSFIVDSEKIYLLYDNAALVNVYGTDGRFQYGIQVSTIKNGHSDIAVVNGSLYFDSRRSIVFVFQGTQLVKTFDPNMNQEDYLSTRTYFSAENTSSTYELSASGNTIVDKNTREAVIDLPQKSKSAEYLTLLGLILLFLSLRGYTCLFGKK